MPDQEVPAELVDAIVHGRCVAFVGAGFSVPTVPPWKRLLLDLVEAVPLSDATKADLLRWLGPNVALSLSTILGDTSMLRRALRANALGVGLALALALVMGLLLNPDPSTPELAARSHVGLSDLVLALASGAAGTLAFTSGAPSTLVGVMVAVALMPPTMAVGLHAGAGHLREAGQAATLLLANVICVNLAGTLTFALMGVRPRTWWEANRASVATKRAVAIWLVLLVGLVLLLVISPFHEPPVAETLADEIDSPSAEPTPTP